MKIVTVIDLQTGVVEEAFGPFPDGAAAMDFADAESSDFEEEHPGYEKESSDEVILVSMPDEKGDVDGKVYQVVEIVSPVTVVDDDAPGSSEA